MIRTLHVDTGREMQGGQWQVRQLVDRLENATLLAPSYSPLGGTEKFSFAALSRLARENDLIHAHDARAHTMAAFAGATFSNKVPLVVSRRVAFPVKTTLASRWKYGRAAMYLAVSEFVAGELRKAGVPDSKIRVVYDGVEIPQTPSRRDPGRVVALANKSAALAGIPVHPINNLWEDLSSASVLLYVSEMEGLGSAALAAMASGVPVVASGVGGLPEAVEHERTGLIVRDGDYAGAVRRLLDNQNLAAEMGQAGRELAMQKFSIKRMVDATIAAYKEVAK